LIGDTTDKGESITRIIERKHGPKIPDRTYKYRPGREGDSASKKEENKRGEWGEKK